MCTSFVYRKENIIIGMNFDNDGKEFRISTNLGNDFLVSVKINKTFFPSFGINKAGVFINDLMVDSCEEGKYKRQNEKRWIPTTLVKKIMDNQIAFADLHSLLSGIEIVNSPNSSTHNLVVDRKGNTCVIEPGRKNIPSKPEDSSYYTMTNFPLSDYDEIQPETVTGSGSDRYLLVNRQLAGVKSILSPDKGFKILKSVEQHGPDWRTDLSLIYDPVLMRLLFRFDNQQDTIFEYKFKTQEIIHYNQSHEQKTIILTKKGITKNDI